MKKRFLTLVSLLALVLLPLSLLGGCSAEGSSEEPAEKPRYFVNADTASTDPYVTCPKESCSEQEQAILDQYYDQMVVKYPEFGKIPREMLQEEFLGVAEEFEVSFTFYFGGRPTDCKCTFRKTSASAQGEWELKEDAFKKFYQSGLTEEQMAQLEEMAYSQIDAYIEKYKLKQSDDRTGIYFTVVDGEACVGAECIADVTLLTRLFTTKEFGCDDHDHVFGTVVLDIKAE